MTDTDRVGGNKWIEKVVRKLGFNHGVGGEHLDCGLADVTVGDGQTELQSLGLTSKYRNIERSDTTEYRHHRHQIVQSDKFPDGRYS